MNTELLSKLQSLNIEGLTNPKTIQNVLNVMEQLARSPHPQLRQLAQTIQHRLDNNQTFQTMQKVEEIKVAEQAVQQEKRVEQVHRYEQAAEIRLGEKKKQEKAKQVEMAQIQQMLGNFASFSMVEKLAFLDNVLDNFEQITPKEKAQLFAHIADAYPANGAGVSPQEQAKYEQLSAKEADHIRNVLESTPPNTSEMDEWRKMSVGVTEKCVAGVTNITAHKEPITQQDLEDLKTHKIKYFDSRLNEKYPNEKIYAEYDKNGKVVFFKVDEYGTKIDISQREDLQDFREECQKIADTHVFKDKQGLEEVDQLKEQKIAAIKTFSPDNALDSFDKINELFYTMQADCEQLEKKGAYFQPIDKTAQQFFTKDLLFSDVLKKSPDLTMAFHIAVKDMLREQGKADKDPKAYQIFTMPFVQNLLKQGDEGEKMLEGILKNQWWGSMGKDLVAEMQAMMKEPDFQQKVEAAKLASTPIEQFQVRYHQEKTQDALMSYFQTEPELRPYAQALQHKYPEFADGKIRSHLIKKDLPELIQFIEQETGRKIEPEKLETYLKNVGVNKDDVKQILAENNLKEEKESIKDKGDDVFNTLELPISNSKELAETAEKFPEHCKPSNLKNDEENAQTYTAQNNQKVN